MFDLSDAMSRATSAVHTDRGVLCQILNELHHAHGGVALQRPVERGAGRVSQVVRVLSHESPSEASGRARGGVRDGGSRRDSAVGGGRGPALSSGLQDGWGRTQPLSALLEDATPAHLQLKERAATAAAAEAQDAAEVRAEALRQLHHLNQTVNALRETAAEVEARHCAHKASLIASNMHLIDRIKASREEITQQRAARVKAALEHVRAAASPSVSVERRREPQAPSRRVQGAPPRALSHCPIGRRASAGDAGSGAMLPSSQSSTGVKVFKLRDSVLVTKPQLTEKAVSGAAAGDRGLAATKGKLVKGSTCARAAPP